MKKIILILLLCVNNLSYSQPNNFYARGIGGGGALFFPKINPANNNEFYISCDMSQLFHSTNFGGSYNQIHFSKLQSFNVSTYEFTNDVNIAYSNFNDGNEGYPVKTIDGGNNWNMLSGHNINNGKVFKMIANYNNPQQIILNYYGSIVISNNGGNSFSQIKLASNNNVGIVLAGCFFDGNTIYVATSEGLFYSTNGGSSFNSFSSSGIAAGQSIWHFSGAKNGSSTRFLCITANSADVYCMVMPYDYYGFAKGVYTMDNTNGTWLSKNNGINFSSDMVMYTAMAENNTQTMYLAGSDNSTGTPLIYKSTDAGTTWNKIFKTTNNQNIKTGWSGYQGDKNWTWSESVFGLAVAPNNADKLVFGDYGFVHTSIDGGNNWQQAYVNTNNMHNAGASTPQKQSYASIGLENTTNWQVFWANNQTMFGCFSDIGLIKSVDSGKTWSYNYNGLSVNSVYRMAKTNNGNLYAACSNIHDIYQSTYLTDAKLDINDANGKIAYSTDGGNTFSTLKQFNHPVHWLTIDPNNTNRMYASVIHYGNANGVGGIYVCNDLQNNTSATWTKLPNPPRTEGHPSVIEVLKNGNVLCIYSGRRNSSGVFTASSGVFLYNTVSQIWSDLSDNGMKYWTKDIVIDPNDTSQSTWYVSVYSGWGGAPNGLGGLYKTINKGQTWNKLTGSQFDRVSSISFNPNNKSEAYLSTETQGLWMSKNMNVSSPTFSIVQSYPFRQPERVYTNPYNSNEIWVSSFGNGMKMGNINASSISNRKSNIHTFKVFPNPANSFIQLENIENSFIEIYDLLGKKHYAHWIEESETISLQDLPNGVYIISVNQSIFSKFVKTD